MIDTLAIIGYLFLVYVFGWEGWPPHDADHGFGIHQDVFSGGEIED
jgi:hypothetical protein